MIITKRIIAITIITKTIVKIVVITLMIIIITIIINVYLFYICSDFCKFI